MLLGRKQEFGIVVTEDDTFNALKRISFDQMEKIWMNANVAWYDTATIELLKQHRWTTDEFLVLWKKKHNID
jgi:hypothetical protein